MYTKTQRLDQIRRTIGSAVNPIYSHATAYLVNQFTSDRVSEYGIPTLRKRLGQHIWLTWPCEDSAIHAYLETPSFQRRIFLTSLVNEDFQAIEYLAGGRARALKTIWFFEEVAKRIQLFTFRRIEQLASTYDLYINWLEKNSIFDSIYALLALSGKYKPIKLDLSGYLFGIDAEETVVWYAKNVIPKLQMVLYAGMEELYESLQGKRPELLIAPFQTIELTGTRGRFKLSFPKIGRIADHMLDIALDYKANGYRFDIVIGRYLVDGLEPRESYTASNAILLATIAEHDPATVVELYNWLRTLTASYSQ